LNILLSLVAEGLLDITLKVDMTDLVVAVEEPAHLQLEATSSSAESSRLGLAKEEWAQTAPIHAFQIRLVLVSQPPLET
jgi:hypothetical protein